MEQTLYEFRGLPVSRADLDEMIDSTTGSLPSRTGVPVVGVIRNPRSHRNRGHGNGPSDAGFGDNVMVAAPKGRTALAETLARYAAARIELLIIDGGDGTVREVLTCGAPLFGARWPRLIVLPKGKTNALTIDLGMPKTWSLAAALQAAPTARAVRRRPILIEQPALDPGAPDRQVMGFIMGAGVFSTAIDAAQVAHKFGAFQGFAVGMAAAVAVTQALIGLGGSRWRRCAPLRITTGSERHEVPHSSNGALDRRFGVGLSTLHKFPLGLKPFGRGAEGGIRFVMLDAPLRRAVAKLPAVLWGAEGPAIARLGYHRGAAEEIGLQLGEGFVLDGETFPAGDYRLRLGPELTFLVP